MLMQDAEVSALATDIGKILQMRQCLEAHPIAIEQTCGLLKHRIPDRQSAGLRVLREIALGDQRLNDPIGRGPAYPCRQRNLGDAGRNCGPSHLFKNGKSFLEALDGTALFFEWIGVETLDRRVHERAFCPHC